MTTHCTPVEMRAKTKAGARLEQRAVRPAEEPAVVVLSKQPGSIRGEHGGHLRRQLKLQTSEVVFRIKPSTS